MATSRKSERRILNKEEFDLVERTRRPAVSDLPVEELSQLITLIRERRDRARDIAHRQSRQQRGKNRSARGEADGADTGNRYKAALLGEALTRVIEERSRRSARSLLVESARKALAMKLAAARQSRPSPGRTANEGMKPQRKERVERIGSAMEAGRVSQFVRDAQAKRDGR